MKKRFTKIISSLLILAFLVSALAIFASADATEGADNTAENITILYNRSYDDGWNANNGFTGTLKENVATIEYEETANFDYNYYTRLEATNTNDAYFELKHGNNRANFGESILEMDLKLDDVNNIGTIGYMRASNNRYSLLAIVDNALYIVGPGEQSAETSSYAYTPDYYVGQLGGGDWIHVAFVFSVNQRKCPVCGKEFKIDETVKEGDYLCCTEENGGQKASLMDKLITARIYFGYASTFSAETAIPGAAFKKDKDLTNNTYYVDVKFPNAQYLDYYRFGTPAGHSAIGSSYLFDNLKVYNGVSMPTKLPADNYGTNVNTLQAKTENILSADATKTALQYLSEGLVMKVGSDYCLASDVRKSILTKDGKAYGAPVKIDGEVYIPLQAILDWLGYPMYAHDDNLTFDIATEKGSAIVTIGRTVATANGELIQLNSAPGYATDKETGEQYLVIAMSDVENLFEGYHVTYDSVGLLAISLGENLFNRDTDLTLMLDTMRKFLYDYSDGKNYTTGDDYYNAVKANTNNFAHPYILADQDDFDAINEAYTSDGGDLKTYAESVVAGAEKVYAKYASADPATSGKYLASEILNPNADAGNNGYDAFNGRLDAAAEYNEELRLLALAYQITRDTKYAALAYEFACSMGRWTHWGPYYFVSCANATAAYAMAYDWLYNAWISLGYDVVPVETALYQNGVVQGYRSATGEDCAFTSNSPAHFTYIGRTDSWSLISTSGMAIGSLALLGINSLTEAEGRYDEVYEVYTDAAKYLLENNIKDIIANALEMYAPDGSFEESASYWATTTNAFALMSWALESAAGSDMGLMDTWGMDNTFLQALQLEFSSYGDYISPEGFDYDAASGLQIWDYHTSLDGDANTSLFFYAAYATDNDGLAAVRKDQLNKKPVSIWDVIGYKADYSELSVEEVELQLDYVFYNLEGVTSRSDWEDGAIFTGIMGNSNDVANGQIDSGNFIYANKNFTWFADLGGENPDAKNVDNDEYRYGYYRNNAEGHNTLYVFSDIGIMPQGQLADASGVLEAYESTDAGMYAIINNTEVYGSTVISARRGLLFTNNRQTVVIQDEINFNNMRSCAWVAQTAASKVIIDSNDGRTAYLGQDINGETVWIRVSIVSADTNMSFELANAYTFKLNTFAKSYSKDAPEYDRSMFKKLMITTNQTLNFRCAIVIEQVESSDSDALVQYEYTEMASWDIDEQFKPTVKDENKIGNSTLTDIRDYGTLANNYAENGIAFSTRTKDFFRNMAYVAAAVKIYGNTGAIDSVKEVLEVYNVYVKSTLVMYNMYKDNINTLAKDMSDMSVFICGYN